MTAFIKFMRNEVLSKSIGRLFLLKLKILNYQNKTKQSHLRVHMVHRNRKKEIVLKIDFIVFLNVR